MTFRAPILALVSLAIAIAPRSGRAQLTSPAIHPGTTVRLTLADGSRITGRAVSSSDSAFVLQSFGGVRTVPITTIRRTELGHSGWARGGATGAIIGACVGIGGLVAIAGALCDSGSCPLRPQYILAGAAAGAAPGFVIGTIIGSFRVHWTTDEGPLRVGSTFDRRDTAPRSESPMYRRALVGVEWSVPVGLEPSR